MISYYAFLTKGLMNLHRQNMGENFKILMGLIFLMTFVVAKTLCTALTVMMFESLHLIQFCFQKFIVRKRIFLCFSGVFSANLVEIR